MRRLTFAWVVLVALGCPLRPAFAAPPACGWTQDAAVDVAACTRALDRNKDARARVPLLVSRGMAHWRLKHFEAAAQDATEAIGIDSGSAGAWQLRALVDAQSPDFRSALPSFDTAIALDPRNVYALVGRAQVRNRAGDVDGALADLAAALKLDGANVYALGQRAEILRKKGDLAAALADVSAAIRAGTKDPQIYMVAAMISRDQDRPDSSLVFSDKAIALGARSAALHRLRAQILIKQDLNRALQEADTAVSLGPNDAESYEIRAKIFAFRHELGRQISDLGEVVRLRPKDALAFRARSWAYVAAGDLRRADLDLEDALALDPSQAAVIHFERSRLHLAQNDTAKALASLDASLKAEPDFPLAHDYRAHLRAENGDAQGAEEDRVAAKGIESDYWVNTYRDITAMAQKADRAGASRRLDQVLKADDRLFPKAGLVELLRLSAKLHAGLGQNDLALADLGRLAPLAPDPSEIYLRRAAIEAEIHDDTGALADFERARAAEKPGAVDAMLAKAHFLIDREHHDAAILVLAEAIAKAPSCGRCLNARAWALVKLGQPADALVDADKALNLQPDDPDTLDTRAHALEGLGRMSEAVAAYRRALAKDPGLTSSRDGLKRLGVSQ